MREQLNGSLLSAATVFGGVLMMTAGSVLRWSKKRLIVVRWFGGSACALHTVRLSVVVRVYAPCIIPVRLRKV
ncbi:hypothetical protein SKAU_G00041900 [Synaphobranchus kaupii]|uniref:Uncharacterized protein n=1 Tax=Synaphobranchus kaupii TaxID=118154 RepID=A0A9Q1G2L1_SYNKA|nr:hypothetical protein SKAU_G00041900 [Synaphobranchus kaupii]